MLVIGAWARSFLDDPINGSVRTNAEAAAGTNGGVNSIGKKKKPGIKSFATDNLITSIRQ